MLWKTSCLVPVPNKGRPAALGDCRPVALTSHIMKIMERLVLAHLRPLVCPSHDPLQFAYQPHVGVDDAIIYLLQKAYSSLDRPNTSVHIMFFDFCSAFNTIQLRLLKAKLEDTQVGAPLVTWVDDYLTGRPQLVRLQNCVSDRLISNIRAPQGTVLSPFLFTTYIADFQYCTESCPGAVPEGGPGGASAPLSLSPAPPAGPPERGVGINNTNITFASPPPPRRTFRSATPNACRPPPGHPTKKSLEPPLVVSSAEIL